MYCTIYFIKLWFIKTEDRSRKTEEQRQKTQNPTPDFRLHSFFKLHIP